MNLYNIYKRLNIKCINNKNNLIEKKDYIIFYKKDYVRSYDIIHNFNKYILDEKILNGYIFLYAIPNILSEWELNELKNKLLITMSDYHINIIYLSDKYINLKTIIKDGSLFMNKLILKNNNYILNENYNIELMKQTIKECYDLAYKLYDETKKYLNIDWCVYKSTDLKMNNNQCIDYIIPFSTSSDFNICKNWGKNFIYKILIDKNTPVICLEKVYDNYKEDIYSYIYSYFNIKDIIYKSINKNIKIIQDNFIQKQNKLYEGEVFLLPGKLIYINEQIIEFNDIDPITLITCKYEKYEFIDIINKIN
jgi:hypothetical protein